MMRHRCIGLGLVFGAALALIPNLCWAQDTPLGLVDAIGESAGPAQVVRLGLALSLLALGPAVAICTTPFIRIVIVLAMLRHAFGMPETPPSQVLVSVALLLTAFVMSPTLAEMNSRALTPFMSRSISLEAALEEGSTPLRDFMLAQVRDTDLAAVYAIAKRPLPDRAENVGFFELTTAFMLNELRVAFKIGFLFLPFLLIDIVVSSILLSLGMLMVPPATLSLPLKVLMFVLIDGWALLMTGVAESFQ